MRDRYARPRHFILGISSPVQLVIIVILWKALLYAIHHPQPGDAAATSTAYGMGIQQARDPIPGYAQIMRSTAAQLRGVRG